MGIEFEKVLVKYHDCRGLGCPFDGEYPMCLRFEAICTEALREGPEVGNLVSVLPKCYELAEMIRSEAPL